MISRWWWWFWMITCWKASKASIIFDTSWETFARKYMYAEKRLIISRVQPFSILWCYMAVDREERKPKSLINVDRAYSNLAFIFLQVIFLLILLLRTRSQAKLESFWFALKVRLDYSCFGSPVDIVPKGTLFHIGLDIKPTLLGFNCIYMETTFYQQ